MGAARVGWVVMARSCSMTTKPRVCTISFARVYPLYVAKAERKGRTQAEVDEIIRWLTGYSQEALKAQLEAETDVETFLAEAPRPNPSRDLIRGVVCGVSRRDRGIADEGDPVHG